MRPRGGDGLNVFDRHQIISSLVLCGLDSRVLTNEPNVAAQLISVTGSSFITSLCLKVRRAEHAEISALSSLAAAFKWKVSQHQAVIARCQSGTQGHQENIKSGSKVQL